ncbi:MAG: N-acetylmuramoyl-L-alanine amidase [Pseudomonadota bacterium]|nr:N-acetylmuramoyl-L-alanine amidase [Pseudomonadota bacterium]
MPLTLIDRPSPNHDARPSAVAPDMLVLHYTGMVSGEAALTRLCDDAARVSAHYVVDEDGVVYRLVAEDRRAWHAGVSCWRGDDDINDRSIGVELVNPGHEFGYRPFTDAQMASVVELCRDIVGRYPIPPRHVLGHADVAWARRQDPGELFDWAVLAAAGVGLWPDVPVATGEMGLVLRRGDGGGAVDQIRHALDAFGYDVAPTGVFDEALELVVIAFQRHFRPRLVDGVVDPETAQRIFQVLAQA